MSGYNRGCGVDSELLFFFLLLVVLFSQCYGGYGDC
jgi:hypothetical protein